MTGFGRTIGNNKKNNVLFAGIGIIVVLIIIIVIGAVISRYTPTKNKMSGYDYFGVDSNSNKVVVILDNEKSTMEGIYDNERLYLEQSDIAKYINQRFYYDKESDSVLFTDSKHIYTFKTNEGSYTDESNNTYSEEFNIVKNIDGTLYIDFEFVSRYTDLTYECFSEPQRVAIITNKGERTYVNVTKDTSVRYRGGIKSDVLENVVKGDKLYYRRSIDEWEEVETPSGYIGYIKDDCVGDAYSEAKEPTYSDDFTSITKDYKISLAWFQTTNATANGNISSYLAGTSGITTISPTWYSITSNSGDMSCIATSGFVANMHSQGIEVWPLIDDFADNLDGTVLYGSRTARTKMINTLISDAKTYNYDGLNLDCEKVTKDGAADYLQFVRELSVACRKNNIVLSVDNYKPESYNAFYDLAEQSAFVDYVIIMGYDEHYAGSESGSVASIGFVEDGITSALELVPKEKLLNAIPFYTRIWTVTTTNGNTVTTSRAVGMQEAIDDLASNGVPAMWDESFGQYFGSYEKSDGSIVKIWVEEDRSVEEKMKLISKYELAGVAEWKLGLEKKSVWSVISQYNK